MNFKKLVVMAGILFLLPVTAGAATVKTEEVVGKFGFDWLKPAKAKCVAVSAEAASKFKACEYMAAGDTGSFTGQADFYKCRVGEKSEFMIYKTQARCVEELQTMEANGE